MSRESYLTTLLQPSNRQKKG
uniref:Uncharacterized protein n=1 Tax=Brugia malayi TaxID=6279 RepID=A8QAY5_BRUMA